MDNGLMRTPRAFYEFREYENGVADVLASVAGANGVVRRNVMLSSRADNRRRQIDVLVKGSIFGLTDARLPGSLMAWWAVDLAARQGVSWVRRHAQVPQVAVYDQALGFALVREEQRTHARLNMLARKAERLDRSLWFGAGFRGWNVRAAWSPDVQADHRAR